jgi:anti-sigma-K factor RskA
VTEQDNHDIDLAGAYVLDTLSPEERESFEAHLASCATCRAEVAELRQVVDILPLAAEPAEPPAYLRSRILAAVAADEPAGPRLAAVPSVTPERRQRWRARLPAAVLAAVAAVVIAALGLRDVQLQQRLNNQQAIVTFHQHVTAAIAQGATVAPILGTTATTAQANAALIQPRNGKPAYLVVQGLPASPAQKVYQLWLLRGTTPRSAGVFTYRGSDLATLQLAIAPTGYTATAVTVEPGPRGSRGPTTRPVLSGKLGA